MSKLAVVLLALLLAHPRALAQDGSSTQGHLTSRGRIMPGGEISAFWSNDQPTIFGNYATYSTWTVNVAPSLVYFVRDDIGIGIAAGVGYARGKFSPRDRYQERDYAIGTTAIWNIPLGARVSLMLRPFLGYVWSEQDARIVDPYGDLGPSGAQAPRFSGSNVKVTSRLSYVRFALSLPVVYAITDAVGVGIGPDFLYDVCFRDAHAIGSSAGTYRPPSPNRMRIGLTAAFYASF